MSDLTRQAIAADPVRAMTGDEIRELIAENERLTAELLTCRSALLREGMERDEAREAAREMAEYRPVLKADRDNWIKRFPWLEEETSDV